jgi:N-acetylglutamate synthase-like GNAT family acetyltransferase
MAVGGEWAPGIRAATVADAAALIALMRELGYEVTEPLLRAKLTGLAACAQDQVLVATAGEALIGCIACHVLEPLHLRGRLGRITALVIDPGHQRRGVGGRLLEAAQAFFAAGGCTRVEVASAEHRTAAHAFYLAQGFSAASRRFIKTL